MLKKVLVTATWAVCCFAQNTLLDNNISCENFEEKFVNIKDMKVRCTRHNWKTKWQCFLTCLNGMKNVWSYRHIECKAKNHPDEWNYNSEKPTIYKWKPNAFNDVDSICNPKPVCEDIHKQYNVSDKLLSWEKTEGINARQTLYVFR